MKYNPKDKKRSGIYVIRVIPEDKVYVGASVDIYSRIGGHIQNMSTNSKDANRHLKKCWNEYGRKLFEYFVVEYINNPTKEFLMERENFWMEHFKSRNPTFGYNLRGDTSEGMLLHEETSIILKKHMKERWNKFPELRQELSERTKLFWKNNPEKRKIMSIKIKAIKEEKYKYLQMNEDSSLVKVFDTVEQIIVENPTYKWQNIYSVCNGYKKRIYGFKWKRILKNEPI